MKTAGSMQPHEKTQQDVIAFLADPASHGGAAVRVITTQISHLFLTPDRAYKLKRPVTLPFLDYAPLDARATACRHEMELNRRLAPGLYLGVVAVTREADGKLALDGSGEPVDWLIVMNRFPDEALASRMAASGSFTLRHAAELADVIAAFHGSLAPDQTQGSPDALKVAITDLRQTLDHSRNRELAARGQALADRLLTLTEVKAARIDARRTQGKVRLCHGDLHLGNIVMLDGIPRPFDGIEFSDAIATIDVLFDLAFAVMDLLAHDLPDHANLLLNRYLAATRDYDGLDLLPLYLGTRALIRVMSELMTGADDRALRYLAVADAVLSPAVPCLLAVGGLSGSGKSTVARALAPNLGPGPGAILLRSDEIRKRMEGVAPEVKLPESAYAPAVTRAMFDRLEADARTTLKAGLSVILDATHMSPRGRARAERIARDCGVTFQGLWLDVPDARLESRINGRVHDASDATLTVLRSQQTADLGAIHWTRIDGAGTIAEVITSARAALNVTIRRPA
ncbi:bifunctional aminoglycoside phosphotransferase/ATP-binding protein [Govanella unica]|uniref:AAA family ATPase n=1 Tax=Govanella unica TaxID=2975056 RepID=A0A9X3TZ93_9PROT|nr:bifunctional aminoglycoside phosphotransferase/ATP-binding protein [Govania unica]MDA5194504.1 AAA family ATPase [Govania unica]